MLSHKSDVALYTTKKHKGKNEIVFAERPLEGSTDSK